MSATRRPGGRGAGLAAAARRLGAAARATFGSGRLRHAPFALFVAGILAYGAAFAWHMLDRFDLVNLIRDVNYDDAFYYFQIAYHLAEGEFSTFDGGITRTNGYHPLWLLLITPFYRVFDKTEALFAIKAFEVMLVAGGVALAAGAARAARLPWILLFAALPALYQNPALFRGTEAAAGLFMLGLFLLAVCLFARDPARWRWPLAAVAFALPWVRLEYVAVSVSATAALWFVEWSGPGFRLPGGLHGEGPSPRTPRGGWSGRVRSVLALNAAAPLSGAAAGLLAYFTWNAVVFGGLVPVSGAARYAWSQDSWAQEGGYRLTENVHAYLRTGFFDTELVVALEVCVYAAVVWWFSRRSRGRDDWLLLAFLAGVFSLGAGHLAKFAQSVLTIHPGLGEYGAWYFVPAYLMEAIAVPARCCVAVWFLRRFVGPGPHRAFFSRGLPPRAVRVSRLGIVAVGTIFLFARADFTAPFRFVDWHHEGIFRGERIGSHMGMMVMDRVLPEGSMVGSWDSGVMGYFSRFPVVNVDGFASSYEYLHARREGREAAFLQRLGITHMANMRRLDFQQDTTLFEGPPYQGTRRKRQFRLWPAEWRKASWSSVDRAAWFRERMEPHLERRTDGVGLLVDGRLAQAFVRYCAPDELAVWNLGSGSERRTVLVPWTQTPIGFCTSAVVLPHDAPPPVRVAGQTVGEYLADRVGERRPVIDSGFDVYFVGNRLVYVKDPCGPEDVDAPFFLHVDPADPDDLPGPRRRHGFDNLDFKFDEFGDGPGARVGGTCLVEIHLPGYGIAAIRTGQYVAAESGFHHPWEGNVRVGSDGTATSADEYLAVLADRVRERRPAIRSDFDVYFVGNRLVYVKDPCGPEDVDAPFFLHVDPADPDDLPGPRRRHGFDNLDFRFDDRGSMSGGVCAAEVHLPEYGVAAIRTGQYVARGGSFHHLWEGEIRPESD